MDWELIERAVSSLSRGVGVTLTLASTSIVLGFCIGLCLAVMRLSSSKFAVRFAEYYSAFFRGTPLLVQLFLFYYGLGQFDFVRNSPVLWWLIGDATHCAIMALALNTGAYTSEILRGGLMSVPVGLVEAAKAAGMSRVMRFRRIEFPLAIRQALPAYSNELILVVKSTSLASTITVLEITGYAKRLMSQTYAIFEIFAIAGVFYLVLNTVLILVLRRIEGRLTRYQAAAR